MLQLPCNQNLMKERNSFEQKSIMMMSNKEAKLLHLHPTPKILDVLHLQTEWNYK